MLYVLSNSFSAYFNLASEEYLLKNTSEEVFMLWRSEPAIIVGKHQNALAEINYKYIRDNKLKVARRLTGGGTVVHDIQNLNFTFIANGKEGKLIDFKKFVSPIISYLATLGIEAHIGKTNDIRIGDLKISGNAEHVFKKRVLHHGTLLFNSNLKQLRESIKVVPGKYIDKAVQSNRASVTNIIDHLKQRISIEGFISGLMDHISGNKSYIRHQFSNSDIQEINKLVSTKYQTQKWIWQYSPKYTFNNKIELNGKKWDITLHVQKGVISDAIVLKDNILIDNLSTTLQDVIHLYDDVNNAILSLPEEYPDTLAECFF